MTICPRLRSTRMTHCCCMSISLSLRLKDDGTHSTKRIVELYDSLEDAAAEGRGSS